MMVSYELEKNINTSKIYILKNSRSHLTLNDEIRISIHQTTDKTLGWTIYYRQDLTKYFVYTSFLGVGTWSSGWKSLQSSD